MTFGNRKTSKIEPGLSVVYELDLCMENAQVRQSVVDVMSTADNKCHRNLEEGTTRG